MKIIEITAEFLKNDYNTVVVGGLFLVDAAAILGVEADMETSERNLELELIRSRAANTSFFIRTKSFPLRHGF